MDIDTLGRRKRTRRQPSGRTIRPQPRDLFWFEKLHHHGPLPTSYLHAFTEHLARNLAPTLKRLASPHREANLLNRPTQQFDTFDARYNQLIYDLGLRTLQALQDEGIYRHDAPLPTGPWKHRVELSIVNLSGECPVHKGPLSIGVELKILTM